MTLAPNNKVTSNSVRKNMRYKNPIFCMIILAMYQKKLHPKATRVTKLVFNQLL